LRKNFPRNNLLGDGIWITKFGTGKFNLGEFGLWVRKVPIGKQGKPGGLERRPLGG